MSLSDCFLQGQRINACKNFLNRCYTEFRRVNTEFHGVKKAKADWIAHNVVVLINYSKVNLKASFRNSICCN
ncbi:hypothetical protein DSECCO2_597050 [anaerobic digester metagenome]